MKQLVDRLRQRLSIYLFGVSDPKRLNELVGLGYYRRPVIWVSLKLLESLSNERAKKEVFTIISEATNSWFPFRWSLVRDSRGVYWYYPAEEH